MYTKTVRTDHCSDSDVFYCFLGDTCMTGRGFRDESCSRGLSTVTVENVRFASSINTPPFLPLALPASNWYSHLNTNPSWDVSNNTFLTLTVEPSLFYFLTLPLWVMIISLLRYTRGDLTFVVWVCRFKLMSVVLNYSSYVFVCECVWGFFEPCFLSVVDRPCFEESCSRE